MLHQQTVGAEDADMHLFVLHGIYGAGRNWFSIARQLVESRGEVSVHLVDLRGHGWSPAMDPPHTVPAAAGDVAAIIDATIGEPVALLGHSFGGKLAMRLAMDRPELVERLIVVDSSPSQGEAGGAAWRMLDVLEALPGPFASREAGVEALRSRDVPAALAQWLAMNLQRCGDSYEWRFHVPMLRALLADYFDSDTWPAMEISDLPRTVLRASRESVISDETWSRLQALAGGDALLDLREIDGGHWLHVENPSAVLDVLKSVV